MIEAKKSKIAGRIATHAVLIFFVIICVVPFFIIVSNSLVSESTFDKYGFTIFPKEFSLEAYRIAFKNPADILESYKITVLITVTGTLGGMFLMTIFAYAISRPEFKLRNILSFFIYFTMLFSGGMVASYIWYTKYLGLYNNILVLILPTMVSPFNILILRSACKAIPDSLIENARMEGASEYRIFCTIILPLCKAAIATIALFTIFAYWSSWYESMLYMDSGKNTTIQYYLTRILRNVEFTEKTNETMGGVIQFDEPPKEAVRMAICIIAAGPAMVIFPFFQKYFSKGVVVGSVKG